MMTARTSLAALVATVAFAGGTASAQTVFSNNGGFGDSFTNATNTNTGQAVAGSNWYYNNVRANGVTGINTTYARNGNGSAYMHTPGGNGKADIEFYGSVGQNGAGNYGPTSTLGTLGSLNALSFDWYRDSSSTASAWLHPVIRLHVISADTLMSGYLVFEREVSRDDFGFPNPIVAPTDEWTTDNVFGGDYRMWSTGGTLPFNQSGTNGPIKYYDSLRLSEWMADYGDLLVTGVSLGVGSGWGSFTGAVDNVSFGFEGGNNYNFNFEVVPAPGAVALLGLAGLAGSRRRRN